MLRQCKNKMLLSFFLLVFYSVSNICFANTVETQLSSEQVTLGDAVFITYILNNNVSNISPDFSALQKDFKILNTDYGNALNMVNGVTSMQTFWRLQLEPRRAGELIVPVIKFGNNQSTAHKLVVKSYVVNPTTQNSVVNTNEPVFVRAEMSSTSPYVQSQIFYTFKVYFRAQLQDPTIEMPQTKDVISMQLEEAQTYQTTINGNVYNVVEKNFAIFPKKAGTLTILPMQFHAYLIDENVSAFSNPFNVVAPKAVNLATKAFNLTVRDVPSKYQGTTWLPAKNISLKEQWSDQTAHWEAGVPVTRTITIEAKGLRADQLSDLTFDKIKGVNVYVDAPKRTNNIEKDSVVGVLEQKVTYIPNNSQSFTIPPIKINWWNTQTDTNAVAQLNALTVEVKPSLVSSSSNAVAATPALLIPDAQATHEQRSAGNTFYKSMWFWIACSLLAAWIVTLFLMLRKKPIVAELKVEAQTTNELTQKDFAQACHTGQAMQAQKFLLDWAKDFWPEVPHNLSTLRELIHDEAFKLALIELEQSLYAKKSEAWNGEALLVAFSRIKKSRRNFGAVETSQHSNLSSDPLPPLYPT